MSPWFLESIPVTPVMDWLVGLLRLAIADTTTSTNNVVMEENDVLSSGVMNEVFYTKWMPISAGKDTYLRIGRWSYNAVNSPAEAIDNRAYLFNETSGSFWIPSGAIYGTSGGKVYLSYSWIEEQAYTHTDTELQLYIRDAITEINNGYYNFGHFVSGVYDSFDVYPVLGINDVAGYLYVKYATYLIRKQQESEGLDNRIYVKDLNVTIDTAKGLGDLAKSANDLINEIKDIVKTLKVEGQESAFARIDTYSTYVAFTSEDNYQHRYINDTSYFGTK